MTKHYEVGCKCQLQRDSEEDIGQRVRTGQEKDAWGTHAEGKKKVEKERRGGRKDRSRNRRLVITYHAN